MRCPSCGCVNLEGEDACQECGASFSATELSTAENARGLERRILDGLVSNLKPKAAATVVPAQTVGEAIEEMRRRRIGCLLVVDGARLEGMVSERDLLIRLPPGAPMSSRPVSEIMRPKPQCLREDDPLADAFHAMAIEDVLHLAVRLKAGGYGVVSARDLLRYLCE